MKCVKNAQNGGGLGWLWVTQGHRKLCVYLAPFIEIQRVLFVEIRRLYPTPPASGAPVGVTPFEFRKDFWQQKTRVNVLLCGVVCVFLCLAILVEHRLVTDRQTDTERRTDRHTAIAYTARA